jgi:hypothetical protein
MRRRTVLQLLALASLGGLLGINSLQGAARAPVIAAGQVVEETSTARAGGHLRIAVNGRDNPEEVPDQIAYRLFVQIVAVHDDASKMEILKRNAFLAEVGLSAQDRLALIDGLDGLGNALKQAKAERKIIDETGIRSQSTALQLSNLTRREDEALGNAIERVNQRLSAEGRDRLETHIRERVKRRVVMYDRNH